jgi:hypothetical protein
MAHRNNSPFIRGGVRGRTLYHDYVSTLTKYHFPSTPENSSANRSTAAQSVYS